MHESQRFKSLRISQARRDNVYDIKIGVSVEVGYFVNDEGFQASYMLT